MPPTTKESPCGPTPVSMACLDTVSVVMMAVAAAVPPSVERSANAVRTPSRTFCRGSATPIRPVEQTTTSPAPDPTSSPTSSAVACVVWKPSGPVKQFAPPELRTTALRWPSALARSLQSTGWALHRLEV